jgi:hypothetical protein
MITKTKRPRRCVSTVVRGLDRNEVRPMPDDATKRCTRCGEVKPLNAFWNRTSSHDGRYPSCRVCESAVRKGYQIDRSASRQRSLQWRLRHLAGDPEFVQRERERGREYRERVRGQTLDHYGRTCSCCGAAERLEIDHVGGDGAEHREALWGVRRGVGAAFCAWLIRNNFPLGYQVLCKSCNRSKGRGGRCQLDHSL